MNARVNNLAAAGLVDGFHPVTASDIENSLEIAYSHVEVMAALFRVIVTMGPGRDFTTLCKHGAHMAEEVANDLDELRERAAKAGVIGGAA